MWLFLVFKFLFTGPLSFMSDEIINNNNNRLMLTGNERFLIWIMIIYDL
jgi:hypothetical protein